MKNNKLKESNPRIGKRILIVLALVLKSYGRKLKDEGGSDLSDSDLDPLKTQRILINSEIKKITLADLFLKNGIDDLRNLSGNVTITRKPANLYSNQKSNEQHHDPHFKYGNTNPIPGNKISSDLELRSRL